MKNPDLAQQEIALNTVASLIGISSGALLLNRVQKTATEALIKHNIISVDENVSGNTNTKNSIWSVKGVLEVKLLLSIMFSVTLPDNKISLDFLSGVLETIKYAASCNCITWDSVLFCEEIIALHEEAVKTGKTLTLDAFFENSSKQINVIAAIISKNRTELVRLGVDYWSFERKGFSSLVSIIDVLVEANIGFLNLCIDDLTLSVSKGTLHQYIQLFLKDLKNQIFIEKTWGSLRVAQLPEI